MIQVRKDSPARTGFTLIEILFALLIIALLARVSLPQFNSIFRINLKSGAAKVASYFQAAYERSVMRHEHIRVSFNPDSGQFWAELYRKPEPEPPWTADTKIEDAIVDFQKKAEQRDNAKTQTAIFEKLESDDLQPDHLPKGIKIKGVYLLAEQKLVVDEEPHIDFLPSGFSSSAIVYVTNDNNDVYSVILAPIGGKVRVEKGEWSPDEV